MKVVESNKRNCYAYGKKSPQAVCIDDIPRYTGPAQMHSFLTNVMECKGTRLYHLVMDKYIATMYSFGVCMGICTCGSYSYGTKQSYKTSAAL